MQKKILVDANVFEHFFRLILFEMKVHLTVITGYGFIYQQDKLESPQKDIWEIIHRNAKNCNELLEMMSTYIFLESRGLTIIPREFDVSLIIQQMVEKHRNDSLEIVVLSPMTLLLWHDESEIAYIIDHLLGSIHQPSYKKVAISLHFGAVDDKTWFLRFTRNKPETWKQEIINNSCEYFIIRKMIALLGGTIEIGNDTDNHAYYTVTFPIRYEAPSSEKDDWVH